jgi:hypothetical protein
VFSSQLEKTLTVKKYAAHVFLFVRMWHLLSCSKEMSIERAVCEQGAEEEIGTQWRKVTGGWAKQLLIQHYVISTVKTIKVRS